METAILTTEHVGSDFVIRVLCDVLDSGNAVIFKAAMNHLTPPPTNVVVNLGCVRFVDSSCLAILFAFGHRVRAAGGDLTLCGLNKGVRALLELTQMSKTFQTCVVCLKAHGS